MMQWPETLISADVGLEWNPINFTRLHLTQIHYFIYYTLRSLKQKNFPFSFSTFLHKDSHKVFHLTPSSHSMDTLQFTAYTDFHYTFLCYSLAFRRTTLLSAFTYSHVATRGQWFRRRKAKEWNCEMKEISATTTTTMKNINAVCVCERKVKISNFTISEFSECVLCHHGNDDDNLKMKISTERVWKYFPQLFAFMWIVFNGIVLISFSPFGACIFLPFQFATTTPSPPPPHHSVSLLHSVFCRQKEFISQIWEVGK